MRADAEDDWDLFARAPQDDGALARLFERHRHYVYRLAWGLLSDDDTADDVVQEVFLKIRLGRMKAAPRAKFTTWLYKVALNTAREQGRRKRKSASDAGVVALFGAAASADEPLSRVDDLQDLGAALARLPMRQREIVVLRVLEGFGTGETAEIVGCREGTVKAHLHRATASLRKHLTQD